MWYTKSGKGVICMKSSNSKERLKELMKYYRISQTDICKRTGIGKSAISQYLSGEREPRQDKVSIIADAYSLNPAWLMGYDVPMFSAEISYEVNDEKSYNRIKEYYEKMMELNESDMNLVMNLIDTLSKKP